MKNLKMQKLLSLIACLVFVLVGGISLSACGAGDKISKDEFIDYISKEGIVSQFDGYELSSTVGSATINATIVSNDDVVNAKIVYPDSIQSSRSGTIYIKDNIVYFTTAENKYYLEIDDYNSEVDNLSDILNYNVDLTDNLISFVNNTTNGKMVITQETDGNKVTYKLNCTIEVNDNKTVNTIELQYENNKMSSFLFKVVTNDITVTEISLKAFSGNIDFPDFSKYVQFPNVENIDLEEVGNYLQNLDCAWSSYDVFDGICQNVKYDAKVSIVDEKIQVEVVAENGKKVYLKDDKIYFDNGQEKLWTTFDGFENLNLDDQKFGEAYEFILSAVVVEDNLNFVFDSAFIVEELKYLEDMVSSGVCRASVEKSTDGDLTTLVITLSYEGQESSRILIFDESRLLEYSAEYSSDITSFVYSNVAIEFPNLNDFVEAV